MKVNCFGVRTILATAVLTGGVITTMAAPSVSCPLAGKYEFSQGRQSLPLWVGAAAIASIAGSVVANEMTKKTSD